MSYCTNCGSQLAPGARFCTSCGTPTESAAPLAAPAASAGAPQQPQPQQFQPQQPQQQQPQQQQPQPQQGQAYARNAPAARPVSAFSSVPVSDYIRDALAVFLLLISMFMVWTFGTASSGSVAATRIDVILITLVSMFSVTIPYLWRSGVFGPTWDYRRTQLARLVANAPYFVLAVVYLVLELIYRQGLGPAMAFGLAGAILAAQPRRAELGSAPADAAVDKRWANGLVGFAVLVGVLTLVQFIERLTLLPGRDWATTLVTIFLGAGNAALLIWAALGASRGESVRRLIGIGIGVTGAGLALLALLPAVTVVSVIFSAFNPGISLFFWLAFGALSASPSVARIAPEATADETTAALDRTRAIATLAIIATCLVIVVSALVLIGNAAYAGYGPAYSPVTWVVAIFLAAVGAVGGFVTRAALNQHTRQSYLLTAGYAALLFILGLVIVIMAATSYMAWNGTLGLLVAFAFPVGLGLSMFGKASQRESFRTLGLGGHGGFAFQNPAAAWDQSATTTTAGAVYPADGQAHEQHGHGLHAGTSELQGGNTAPQVDEELAGVLEESGNPATPPARLYEIAAQFPPARHVIAGNPAAYEALLNWLAEQQDPEIDEALAQRRG